MTLPRAAAPRLRRKLPLAARLRRHAVRNQNRNLSLSRTVRTRLLWRMTPRPPAACPTQHAVLWPPLLAALRVVSLPALSKVTLRTTIRCRKTTRIRLRPLKSQRRKTHPRRLPARAARVPTSKLALLSSRVGLDRYGQEKAASPSR
jgi:hypothetical protein